MIKSANIYKFKNDSKFILHPLLSIKDFASLATSPYLTKYDPTSEELLESLLHTLEFSKEGTRPDDMNEFQKTFLKSMGFKSRKSLHQDSILLDVTVKDAIITFYPTINSGASNGFTDVPLDQRVVLPLDSQKEELVKGLELALSRCKY